ARSTEVYPRPEHDATGLVIQQHIDLLTTIRLLPLGKDRRASSGPWPAHLPLIRLQVDMECGEERCALALRAVVVSGHQLRTALAPQADPAQQVQPRAAQ